jgi:hypothetical protein
MRPPRRRLAAAVLMTFGVVAGVLAPASSEPASAASDQKTMGDGGDNRMGAIKNLEKKLHVKRKLDDVLGDVNRQARWPKDCDGPSNPFHHPSKGFCWDDGDFNDPLWYPQGISGSWDREKDQGTYHGHRVTVASWYQRTTPDNHESQAARVTFVMPSNDGKPPRYRHVVLADVSDHDFRAAKAHAGGVAWVGDYLYVADTTGLRVFDIKHIWKTDGGQPDGNYSIKDGKVHAAGYDYVLPQVGSYQTNDKPEACEKKQGPVISSVSVDWTTKTLVTGEYCGGNGKGRLVRWPLKDNGKLESSKKTVTSKDWYYTPQKTMQGVATWGNQVNSTSSHGSKPGEWHPMSLEGKDTGDTLKDEEGNHYRAPVPGPEDVSINRFDNDRKGLYWTLSERPGCRYVFPNDADEDS